MTRCDHCCTVRYESQAYFNAWRPLGTLGTGVFFLRFSPLRLRVTVATIYVKMEQRLCGTCIVPAGALLLCPFFFLEFLFCSYLIRQSIRGICLQYRAIKKYIEPPSPLLRQGPDMLTELHAWRWDFPVFRNPHPHLAPRCLVARHRRRIVSGGRWRRLQATRVSTSRASL